MRKVLIIGIIFVSLVTLSIAFGIQIMQPMINDSDSTNFMISMMQMMSNPEMQEHMEEMMNEMTEEEMANHMKACQSMMG